MGADPDRRLSRVEFLDLDDVIALVEGNKRLGWLATAVFLELNDASVVGASNDDVYELVMRVARSEIGVDVIADELHRLAAPPS